jgi:AraC-type DNA-binding domain-containing proteins
LLFSSKSSNIYINFKPATVGKLNLIFLCPGDILLTKSNVEYCKIIEFKKETIPTSENLIYLLFNNSIRETTQSKSIHELRKSNSPKIINYYTVLQTLFLGHHFNTEKALYNINNIIYECVYDSLFGDDKDIIEFTALLNINYNKKHLVSEYAEVLRLPPKELLRAFRRRNYEKPSEIIKDRILLEIKKLLTTTDLDVKHVASKLGFDDPAYFARFFKKNTGKTALEFREEYSNKFKIMLKKWQIVQLSCVYFIYL